MARTSVGTSGWVGLPPKEFSRRYDAVEFNWTFHERETSIEHFHKAAAELRELRLQGVFKVSGLATHERRLQRPEEWWPSLWSKYSVLSKAGVLGGLLWQLAPSHHCTQQTLADLRNLARMLPTDVLHVFEFRHSSWYRQPSVLNILRQHRFCLAWIHITNEDGWCGDLETGWPSKQRTCNAAYFRLFGTKQKAVGRYSEEFLRDEIFSHCSASGPDSLDEAFVIFAQADVPDHAKADATAFIELLGRQTAEIARTSRWERDVLAATLGLAVGSVVEGVVQRISHRTIFLDIGRSCRAFLDANHARRVGLLDSLQKGTVVQGLVVENINFQGEWGHIGLTCHSAVVGLGAVVPPAAASDAGTSHDAVAAPPTAAFPQGQGKRCRWGGSEGRSAAPPKAALMADAIVDALNFCPAPPDLELAVPRLRWSNRSVVAAAAAAEDRDAAARAKEKAAWEAREARAWAWARRAVRRALGLHVGGALEVASVASASSSTRQGKIFSLLQEKNIVKGDRIAIGEAKLKVKKRRSRSEGVRALTRKERTAARRDEAVRKLQQEAQEKLLAAAEARKAFQALRELKVQKTSAALEWLERGAAAAARTYDQEAAAAPTSSEATGGRATAAAATGGKIVVGKVQPEPALEPWWVRRRNAKNKAAMGSTSDSQASSTSMPAKTEGPPAQAQTASKSQLPQPSALVQSSVDTSSTPGPVPNAPAAAASSTSSLEQRCADAGSGYDSTHALQDEKGVRASADPLESEHNELLAEVDSALQVLYDEIKTEEAAMTSADDESSATVADTQDVSTSPPAEEEDEQLFINEPFISVSSGKAFHSITDVGAEDEEDLAFMAVCDRCGTTLIVEVDFMGLGLAFTCEQVGAHCEVEPCVSAAARSTASKDRVSSPCHRAMPNRAVLPALTMEEKRSLFDRHASSRVQSKLRVGDIHHGVLQLLQSQAPKERYRDGKVVTHKGERYVKVAGAVQRAGKAASEAAAPSKQ